MSHHTEKVKKERKRRRRRIAKVQRRKCRKNRIKARPKSKRKKNYENQLFDIEHALGMYAYSFYTIPAESIYDEEAIEKFSEVINTCHIYLIGYTPIIEFKSANQIGSQLILLFEILGIEHTLSYEVPDGLSLKKDDEYYYMESSTGRRHWPDTMEMQGRLSSELKAVNFEVKYVGQAYGKSGSRNAIHRLLKHETLQKISLKGAPKGYRLSLLLLAIQPNNQLFTVINPFAKNTEEGKTRIKSGLDKLFNTSEHERITLYEASLIRYFKPEFNKEFKNSFPSTNLKILQDCYEKDFSGIVAEICIDELPFRLCSAEIEPSHYHIAKYDLHKSEDRRMFFGYSSVNE